MTEEQAKDYTGKQIIQADAHQPKHCDHMEPKHKIKSSEFSSKFTE